MSFAVTAVVAAGATLYGGYMNYQAGQAQAENERMNARHTAEMMKIKEADAKRISENEAGKIRLKGEKLKGTQKVVSAASGVVINKGSNLDIQRETDFAILDDIETVKTNAALEAWGYKTQATNSLLQGEYNARAAQNQGTASLISSVGSAAGSFAGAGKGK